MGGGAPHARPRLAEPVLLRSHEDCNGHARRTNHGLAVAARIRHLLRRRAIKLRLDRILVREDADLVAGLMEALQCWHNLYVQELPVAAVLRKAAPFPRCRQRAILRGRTAFYWVCFCARTLVHAHHVECGDAVRG